LGNCQIFKISNFESERSSDFKFRKLPNLQNFKLNYGKEELKYEKAGKITSQGALGIDTTFLKKPEKK
jgi:hypothetical protein